MLFRLFVFDPCNSVQSVFTQRFLSLMCIHVFLQIAHMTKSELHLPDTAFVGPGLLFLNQYFNSFIDEHIVLWIAMVCMNSSFFLNRKI